MTRFGGRIGMLTGGPSPPRERLTLAALLAVIPLFYAMAYPVLRPLGEAPLLLAIACAAGSAVALGRVVLPLPQMLLSAVATLWLLLSLLHMLPPAWTQHFDAAAAVRQWSWVIMMPLLTTSFFALLKRTQAMFWRYALPLALAWYLVSRIANYFGDPSWASDIVLYGVNNINMPLLVLIYTFIFSRTRSLPVDLMLIASIGAVSTSSTNLAVAVFAAFARATPLPRFGLIAVGGAMLSLLLIAPNFSRELYAIDYNTGVRALMWSDAIKAIFDSRGLGVGFGTEYIRNQFDYLNPGWTLVSEYDPGRLYISTHSAFYDIGLRTGAAGLILFLLWMCHYMPSPMQSIRRDDLAIRNNRLSCTLAAMLFFSIAVNPALVSVNIFVGVAFVLAMLEHLREQPELAPVQTARPRLWRQARMQTATTPP